MEKFLGVYKSLNVGYFKDRKIRNIGSSGGVVTSLLIKALNSKLINGAVVVGMKKEEPWKPEVKVTKTKKEILETAGSKYVLIPIGDILNVIDKNRKSKLAVVGLPCHIEAIRKLQGQKRYKNVNLLIGLFCGYNMPFEATEFLIKKLKVKHANIAKLEYRGGKYPGGFLITTKDGKRKFLPKHYYDFINLMFVSKGCLHCKDFTNELADISVGDTYGYDNCSLVITRTNIGKRIIEKCKDAIGLTPIPEKEVLKMHWHNIKHKKHGDSIAFKAIRNSLKIFGGITPFKFLGFLAKLRRKLNEADEKGKMHKAKTKKLDIKRCRQALG